MNSIKKVYQNFIGIDISKNDFVVSVYGKQKVNHYDNTEEGFNKFLLDYSSELTEAFVVLENTGSYESALLTFLINQQVTVHRADTRKVKSYIRSWGKQAKTDKIDAKALASYGFERSEYLEAFVIPADSINQLKILSQRRIDLVKILVQEKNRSQVPAMEIIKGSFLKIINIIKDEIDEIDQKINILIQADKEIKMKKEVMLSVPGIGNKTASLLLAFLPELGLLNRKKISSLSGLAPHPRQSGNKDSYRPTVGGRRHLRPILFMAAMSARRHHPKLSAFYHSLILKGKKPIVALVAIMRKLIVILNAKIRDSML